jgi:integrase
MEFSSRWKALKRKANHSGRIALVPVIQKMAKQPGAASNGPIRKGRRSNGSVTQKRGLWYAVLSVGHDAKGRQIRHWSKGFETRRKAELELAQLLIEGRRAKQTKATVELVVSRYIEQDVTTRGRRSPTTTQRYRGLLANMEPIHKFAVDQLGGPTIENYYLSVVNAGLSHTTVHHIHNLMFAAFRWGKSRRIGLITRNPFEYDEIEKPRRAKTSAQSFTVEQAQRALEYLARTKHKNALVFSLATACRRGETCGLKWNSVDFHRGIAIIRESRYQVSGEVGQKNAKSEQIREIPLNETALEALAAERVRQGQRREYAGDAWTDSGHVFSDELGLPLVPMALTNAFGRCARKAKLPTTAMHNLRHTAATFILSAGGNPVAARKILGHSAQSTTLGMYGHVIGLDEIRASREIDKALALRPMDSRGRGA